MSSPHKDGWNEELCVKATRDRSAASERGDLPIGFCHRMGEHQAHSYEYMDATYWCRGVGQKPDAARRYC